MLKSSSASKSLLNSGVEKRKLSLAKFPKDASNQFLFAAIPKASNFPLERERVYESIGDLSFNPVKSICFFVTANIFVLI